MLLLERCAAVPEKNHEHRGVWMKFGVFDHLDDSGLPLHEHYRNRLNLVELYDREGLYCYHLAEHHTTPLGTAPSPGIFLSAIAQRTRRIRFGPLVYTLPFYHPLRLIEEICMLDHLSGGRLQLGVGKGVSPFELGYYGIAAKESQSRYFESLDVLRRGLGSDSLDHDGDFYSFRDVPMTMRPLQQPHPPLWYGTNSPEAAGWAAANEVNVVSLLPAGQARAITDRYRREWTALGHDENAIPFMGVSRLLVVAETDAEALDIAGRAYRRWRSSFRWLWEKHGNTDYIERFAPPEFSDMMQWGGGFAGTPASVRDYITREIEDGGINYLIASLMFGDMREKEATASATLYAQEVIPAFNGEE
jgi:alkanesulfonate monooxygenase SsuD/methylene tetrahydromethanopterin reductase-like flavin-dependent oxidoreductase (luciferase family)